MLKKAFKALKVGQRVTVDGYQDGKTFTGEVGTIIQSGYGDVLIRFDTWSDGHGVGSHEWHFDDEDHKNYTISEYVPPVVVQPEPKPRKRPHGAQEYKGNGKHSWETVVNDGHGFPTTRLRVPGGWLYRRGGAPVFVPVPQAVGYAV